MENKTLPARQREVFDFIAEYHRKNGFSPSYSEIAGGLGLSHSTIITYIGILRNKGYVHFLPGIPRSLTVVRPELPENEPAAASAGCL
jgi:repressor LexA